MSGYWIKFEKDLVTDPRVIRMAKELTKRFNLVAEIPEPSPVAGCNAYALPGVTLVLGALTRLWIYADSHCREDDTLDLGGREIDELIGIPDFCSLMPKDWLVVIDGNTVELPGFQEHNGVEAKKKALTQKRVARHRDSKKHNGVSHGNAVALPDQTRPDQTRESAAARPRVASKKAPQDFTPDLSFASATIPDVDAETEAARFKDYEFKTPRSDWSAAWRNWIRKCKDTGQYARVERTKWM